MMGIDKDFTSAFAKAAIAAGQKLPASGNIFITMIDKHKQDIIPIAQTLTARPFCDWIRFSQSCRLLCLPR